MPQSIRIMIGEVSLAAELNDSSTAQLVADALPVEAAANRWGDEFYFPIPVQCGEDEDARAEFDVGELGYWPPGNAFCIFFGPTPASRGEQPMMANPGNPIGRVMGDVNALKGIGGGASVRIEKI